MTNDYRKLMRHGTTSLDIFPKDLINSKLGLHPSFILCYYCGYAVYTVISERIQ